MLTLKGQPLSTQTCYRFTSRGGYMTSKCKSLKEAYQWQIKQQWRQLILEDELELDVTIYFKDKRRRDWDNFHKLSMDAMEGIVFKDDSQIKDAHVHMRYDKENPRIDIKII